tara:strand:- start:2685 stop:3215 length:531 start_codon:yes stop_codon:yes gene_type:complete
MRSSLEQDTRVGVSWENREQHTDWAYEDYSEMNGVKIPKDTTARIYLSNEETAKKHFEPCASFVENKMSRYDLTYRVTQKRGTSAFNIFTGDGFTLSANCKDETELEDRKEAKTKLQNSLSLVNSVNDLAEKYGWGIKSVSRDPQQEATYKVVRFKLSADLTNQPNTDQPVIPENG